MKASTTTNSAADPEKIIHSRVVLDIVLEKEIWPFCMCVMNLLVIEERLSFDWQVCDTAVLLFDVNLCVLVHSINLRNVSVTKTLRSNNVVEFKC